MLNRRQLRLQFLDNLTCCTSQCIEQTGWRHVFPERFTIAIAVLSKPYVLLCPSFGSKSTEQAARVDYMPTSVMRKGIMRPKNILTWYISLWTTNAVTEGLITFTYILCLYWYSKRKTFKLHKCCNRSCQLVAANQQLDQRNMGIDLKRNGRLHRRWQEVLFPEFPRPFLSV